MSSPSDSPQVKLVHAWGKALSTKGMDVIAKFLHKDYRYTPYPRSLGLPEQTRDEWIVQFSEIMSHWAEIEMSCDTIHSVIDAPGKVVVHVTSKIRLKNGLETSRESIFIEHIAIDEDGSLKIEQTEDFTDSKAHLDFTQAIAAATQKK